MKPEYRVLLVVFVSVIVLIGLFSWFHRSNTTIEKTEYKISGYSCDEIKDSILNGPVLLKEIFIKRDDDWSYNVTFSEEELFRGYIILCKLKEGLN